MNRAGKHWQTIFPGHVLIMPYERLVTDFKAAAEDMLEHCEMPWDDAVLDFHQTQRNVHTASLAQVGLTDILMRFWPVITKTCNFC